MFYLRKRNCLISDEYYLFKIVVNISVNTYYCFSAYFSLQ